MCSYTSPRANCASGFLALASVRSCASACGSSDRNSSPSSMAFSHVTPAPATRSASDSKPRTPLRRHAGGAEVDQHRLVVRRANHDVGRLDVLVRVVVVVHVGQAVQQPVQPLHDDAGRAVPCRCYISRWRPLETQISVGRSLRFVARSQGTCLGGWPQSVEDGAQDRHRQRGVLIGAHEPAPARPGHEQVDRRHAEDADLPAGWLHGATRSPAR